jgi:hypothetical protein
MPAAAGGPAGWSLASRPALLFCRDTLGGSCPVATDQVQGADRQCGHHTHQGPNISTVCVVRLTAILLSVRLPTRAEMGWHAVRAPVRQQGQTLLT